MKRVKGLIAMGSVFVIAFAAVDVWAEEQPGDFTVSPLVGRYFYADDDNLVDGAVLGLGLGYNLTKEWGIEASVHYIFSELETTRENSNNLLMRFDGLYNFNVSKMFVPYLAAGLGAIVNDQPAGATDVDPLLHYGGGLKYFLSDEFAVRADVRHQLVFGDFRNNFIAEAGFLYCFGATKVQEKDSDGDGVSDHRDKCPDSPKGAKVDENGCAPAPQDSDKDGVVDREDRCPATEAGEKVDRYGCPLDSDGDGVIDQRDKCPDTPNGAKVDENGCVPAARDSDKDGVVDSEDRCPATEAGVKVDRYGCPLDSDGDGVIDQRDKCPDTPKGAKVDENGCVPAAKDSDKDGVVDSEDRCPDTEAGVKVDRQGCPLDSDADGVYDYLDKCPATPKNAKVDKKGCPLDSDGDGVYDYLDRCPDTPRGAKVDDFGCNIKLLQPVSMQIKIEFDVSKDEIKAQYHDELVNVADFMQTYPDANAEIEGHTDAAGNDEKNMALSQRRAESVVRYLVEKLGVKADKIKAVGYGETHPVASNDTAEGRSQNRRVVATLSGTALIDKK